MFEQYILDFLFFSYLWLAGTAVAITALGIFDRNMKAIIALAVLCLIALLYYDVTSPQILNLGN